MEKRKKVSLADLDTRGDNIITEEAVPLAAHVQPKDAVSILSEEYDDRETKQIFASESELDEEEKEYYLKRRKQYLMDFQINQSSDMTILHQVIMEEIIRERYYKMILTNPTKDFSQQINDATNRLQKALSQLALGRDQRIKNRETGGVSIADIAKTYYEKRKIEQQEVANKRRLEDELLMESQEHKLQAELGIIVETLGEDYLNSLEDDDAY